MQSCVCHRPLIYANFLITARRYVSRIKPAGGKPQIIPVSKTKRYSMVRVPWQDPADVQELLWKRHAYHDAVKTYREMYRKQLEALFASDRGEEAQRRREEEEFKSILAANKKENERLADLRNKRLDEHLRLIEEATLREVDETIANEMAQIRDREADVLDMIERVKNEFVTPENLEQRILHALENPVEYSYAMDRDGNTYSGEIYLKYLTELPVKPTPVSEATASLVRKGALNKAEKGSAA